MKEKGPFPQLGEILIDQGADDQFLEEGQLQPHTLVDAAKAVGQPLLLRTRPGDHSYYFISSFIGEHITHAAKALRASAATARKAAVAVNDASASASASTPVSEFEGKPLVCKAMVAHGARFRTEIYT
jgi:hypothetical protein